MLTKAQEKQIKSLHRKKGRRETGLCLVEGQKVIETAGKAVELTFTRSDSKNFTSLVTTETPQDVAATARIPQWTEEEIEKKPVIVVLDGVQDPGNVGTILRLCLGFNASLLLIESADPTSPKVVRSSVGALFQVPWAEIRREDADSVIEELGRSVYRFEKREGSVGLSSVEFEDQIVLIVGSEGQGIHLSCAGQQIHIEHAKELESLNVASALSIALYQIVK